MSSAQPRIERTDDMGDVLAEIRRLVARGSAAQPPGGQAMIVTARVIGGEERHSSAAQSLALSVEVPMAQAAQQGSAAGSGATSVPALRPALQHDQGTGHRPTPQDAPFRLNPDAMIPAADAPALPPRLRLTPDRGVSEERTRADPGHPFGPQGSGPADDGNRTWTVRHPAGLPGGEADAGLAPLATDATEAQPLGAGQPAEPARRHEGPDNPASMPGGRAVDNPPPAPALQPAAMEAGAASRSISFNREPDMQAYANSPVSPLHAESAPHLGERPAYGAPETLHGDEENPLRALLREVVREEFEGELKRNLDDNLRRMVRAEIAAALTEALVRRPRG